MAIAASAFLTLSLWLAVIIGPQMRTWPWGPALLALAAALTCAAITSIRTKRPVLGPGTIALGTIIAGWFAWRAWTSPVAELAHADLLLLGAAVGCFLVVRAISHDARAEAVFLWGLAALLGASVAMISLQTVTPGFSQFRSIPIVWPPGFYAHYNEGANFLLGAGFLLLGGAVFSRQHIAVKILWLLIAILGLAAVWLTRSRGALFGVIIGFAALATFLLVIGSKRKTPWFAPAVIAFPIILLASGFALAFGWDSLQRMRTEGRQGAVEMMDNTTRLRNYSLAFDAIMLNPMAGGGSRSYSWTSLKLWDPSVHGIVSHLPEQTHNEILQAATDYGLVGAGGILALLAWLSLRGFWHSKFDEEKPNETSISADALRLGGIAALAAMLVQSSFSFVFHLLPGAMLLGLALGRLASPAIQSPAVCRTGRVANAILSLGIAAAMVWPGIAGTRATAALMPVYFRIGPEPDQTARIARFTRAIDAWPQSDLHLSRALIHHGAIDGDRAALGLAADDYLAAAQHNPKFPAHLVNAANLYSIAANNEKAEQLFLEAIELQGKTESVFRAHFHAARHDLHKGLRYLDSGDSAKGLRAAESALENIRQAEAKSLWVKPEDRTLRNSVHLALALAHESMGDFSTALKISDAAFQLGDSMILYHSGMIQYRHAMHEWHQRQPEIALPLFKDARQRLVAAKNHVPPGRENDTIRQQIHEIDKILKLLEDAGFHQP